MSDTEAIAAVLNGYRDALVASDTDAVMKLYAEDGILMAQMFPTKIGHKEVREAYIQIFGTIQLTVIFTIHEIHLGSGAWAFARTSSAGTTKNHKTGAESKEGNQELFVLQKTKSDGWKIARYCFCSTNLPK